MSIQTQINRIDGSKTDIIQSIKNKGVSVPANAKIDELSPLIDSISVGEDVTSELNTYETYLSTQETTIDDIVTALQGKVSGEIKLQEKTVSPTTSQQNVTADSGYNGLSKVVVNAMPTTTQATPSISVSSNGLITASSTQNAGYVSSGTKSSTKQLATKGTTTYTPTTSNQTIASGTYLTGTQTIKGDTNLVASNIKKGVSIFGITGTLETKKEEQTKSVTITQNGTTAITPDSGKVLSSVSVTTNVSLGTTETWTFTMEDETTVTKEVVIA